MVSWSEPDEKTFVARLQARDERAFNDLVHHFERRVFALVFRMLGNRVEAEDLTQEVFVQVFKAIDQFRGDSKLSTWIFRIAVNLCKNRNKYLKRRHSNRQDDIDSLGDRSAMNQAKGTTSGSIDRPDDMLVGRQLERIVQLAIQQLEEDFREALVLRDVEDMSYEEISEITGLPIGTVKSRIHRARERLREAIESMLGEKVS
ncbi:MAG TPA: sigma-70 family RNA polymerase sigma factor [Polyangiaceae bacterium]|nr:MAG: ECF RNA polymerase sigma-E factor [Deltaproteobacteria bacterium ADurb.Bin207]HNS95602.1 sigma-70 family RNA polymerase sigma factor [Polyangiaceae bacterium]HNZ21244.1 sigma-70 family RNA polymerase sigma factor [Polyangiaceae bacterium]HOD21070.1 sigma-70 family RNA polymerase sigma factor [Polyangiaceae bacterium]HOE48632.1 sigma-70 family RNA polymerase sigma factor [Polyangiaceae bacterium]